MADRGGDHCDDRCQIGQTAAIWVEGGCLYPPLLIGVSLYTGKQRVHAA